MISNKCQTSTFHEQNHYLFIGLVINSESHNILYYLSTQLNLVSLGFIPVHKRNYIFQAPIQISKAKISEYPVQCLGIKTMLFVSIQSKHQTVVFIGFHCLLL